MFLYLKPTSVGGALKPSDIETLWVHIICAWFRPEVGFLNHEKMEPATGILRIPSMSFMKVCYDLNNQLEVSCSGFLKQTFLTCLGTGIVSLNSIAYIFTCLEFKRILILVKGVLFL